MENLDKKTMPNNLLAKKAYWKNAGCRKFTLEIYQKGWKALLICLAGKPPHKIKVSVNFSMCAYKVYSISIFFAENTHVCEVFRAHLRLKMVNLPETIFLGGSFLANKFKGFFLANTHVFKWNTYLSLQKRMECVDVFWPGNPSDICDQRSPPGSNLGEIFYVKRIFYCTRT